MVGILNSWIVAILVRQSYPTVVGTPRLVIRGVDAKYTPSWSSHKPHLSCEQVHYSKGTKDPNNALKAQYTSSSQGNGNMANSEWNLSFELCFSSIIADIVKTYHVQWSPSCHKSCIIRMTA
ncbi:hypothetical protein VNO77_19178 [Canavalia gladiata]|uniref:Uncharacterized protein n=1 Tax=Canavalia gladiata TaxID=3824 RepID=A0AAN9LM91_CANGL